MLSKMVFNTQKYVWPSNRRVYKNELSHAKNGTRSGDARGTAARYPLKNLIEMRCWNKWPFFFEWISHISCSYFGQKKMHKTNLVHKCDYNPWPWFIQRILSNRIQFCIQMEMKLKKKSKWWSKMVPKICSKSNVFEAKKRNSYSEQKLHQTRCTSGGGRETKKKRQSLSF